jgi:abortive infection bacteriophage resistance protein
VRNYIYKSIMQNKYKQHDIWNHFNKKYKDSFFPPIWMLLNTSDFWLVTNIYKNLKAELREKISQVYDLEEKIFWQQIEVIRRIRNIVSHHERLFNTSFSYWGSKGSSIKFHDFIKEIDYLKNQIVPTSHWNDKIVKLYNDYEYLTPVKKYKYEI